MSDLDKYKVNEEILYIPQSNEMEIALACFNSKYPLMLRGPTGTGKTTFVRSLASTLDLPLVTEVCNEDTTVDSLVGSFTLEGWYDGSATLCAKSNGAILYLDEIGEARPEAIVVVHALTDDRRELEVRPLEEIFRAPKNLIVIGSYNPTYQMQAKLKPSTLQRFVTLDYLFPSAEVEKNIVTGAGKKYEPRKPNKGDSSKSLELVLNLAKDFREMAKAKELREGPSTRLVRMTLGLIDQGILEKDAIDAALINPLTFDENQKKAMRDQRLKYVSK